MRNFCIVIVLAIGIFSGQAAAAPNAVFPDNVYTFNPVPEGQSVDHVFVVKNTGDKDLNIINVLPP